MRDIVVGAAAVGQGGGSWEACFQERLHAQNQSVRAAIILMCESLGGCGLLCA